MNATPHAIYAASPTPLPIFLLRRVTIACCCAYAAAICMAGCTPPERRVPSAAKQEAWAKADRGPGVFHTAQAGDTLESLAKLYDANADQIRRVNSLRPSAKILPGQQVFIPGAAEVKGDRLELIKDAPPDDENAPQDPSLPARPPKAEYVFLRPLDGPIVKNFGETTLVGTNPGIDIGGNAGMDVVAAKSGIVREVVTKSDPWGKVIVIDHGEGERTLYARLGEATVTPGTRVKQGQVIGRLAGPAAGAKASLHFCIYKGADPVDPRAKLALH